MNEIEEIEEFMKKFDVPYVVAIGEADDAVSFSANGTGRDFLAQITILISECVPKVHQKTFMAIVMAALKKLPKEDE